MQEIWPKEKGCVHCSYLAQVMSLSHNREAGGTGRPGGGSGLGARGGCGGIWGGGVLASLVPGCKLAGSCG